MPSEHTREELLRTLELADRWSKGDCQAAADLLARDGRLRKALEEPPEELLRHVTREFAWCTEGPRPGEAKSIVDSFSAAIAAWAKETP